MPPIPGAIQEIAENSIPSGGGMLVAVSGGLDSMVLLHALKEVAGENNWRLIVAHFNHRLRGRSSGADQGFVKKTASRLGLKFAVGEWRDGDGAIRKHGLEMAARNARLDFLADAAREHGCSHIAMGHHADDQVETFFLRMLRGAGGIGLGGIKTTSEFPGQASLVLIRPQLEIPKAELREFAGRAGIQFREDATNNDTTILRNRVRQRLIPFLQGEFHPGAGRMMRQSMELVGADADFAKAAAARWLEDGTGGSFNTLHPALQRWIVWLQLVERGIEPGYSRIEELRRSGGKEISLDPSQSVQLDETGRLHLNERSQLDYEGRTKVLQLGSQWLEIEFGDINIRCRTNSQAIRQAVQESSEGMELMDGDDVGGHVILRHWRPGDRFQPMGMASAVKLQDLFTNAHVPAREKRRRVLACTQRGEIFWVQGLRLGELAKVQTRTSRLLCWQWRKL